MKKALLVMALLAIVGCSVQSNSAGSVFRGYIASCSGDSVTASLKDNGDGTSTFTSTCVRYK